MRMLRNTNRRLVTEHVQTSLDLHLVTLAEGGNAKVTVKEVKEHFLNLPAMQLSHYRAPDAIHAPGLLLL